MTDPFRYYLRVRYIECDAQKVVFNSRYAEYVDVGINEFLRAAGIHDEFLHGRLDFQLVKQTVEWKAPARFDQVIELTIEPKHLGNTSFTLTTAFRVVDHGVASSTDGAQQPPIVTVETVYVLVDATTLTKLPLPDRIRAALTDGARGKITDHAASQPVARA